MNTRSISSILALVFAGLVTLPTTVFPSACASNPGDWWLTNDDLSGYDLGELKKMVFASIANLYSPYAEPIGITGDAAERYILTSSFVKNHIILIFKDRDKTGTLTLPIPKKMWNFKVDPHDGRTTFGGGPLLYKEWRLEGTPAGTGIFEDGMAGASKYRLLFQGHGNCCDEASHFTHWRLEVTGKNAAFTFHGQLESATGDSNRPSSADR